MLLSNIRKIFELANFNFSGVIRNGPVAARYSTKNKLQKRKHNTQLDRQKSISNEIDYFSQEEKRSALEVFASKKSTYLEWNRYNPMTITTERIYEIIDRIKRNNEIYKQRYIEERHAVLGSDLATAHFIVYREGKVRFHGSNKWIQMPPEEDICPDLPNKFMRNIFVEAIDASNSKIRYEGLVNVTNLRYLKWLSFRNCEYVDDWFLDRLSGEVYETVEYLDLSNCHNVTKNSMSCFYRFKNLKLLVLHNIVKDQEFKFSCMLLEDAFPNLYIDDRVVPDVPSLNSKSSE